MADVALSAVNLVLSFIRDEARLLRGVRGDVQFIMDEMESMNDMLRHLVMTRRVTGEYQCRPWMKQVMELAFDSKNCVELYMQSCGHETAGLINGAGTNTARLRRVSWLPWALVARHQVVNRIRELKVRAREIGERQARYTVALAPAVPPSNTVEEADVVNERWQHDAPRRATEPDPESNILTEGTAELIRWLNAESSASAATTANAQSSLDQAQAQHGVVVAIIGQDGADGAALAARVYEQYKTSGKEGPFECVLRVSVRRPPLPIDVLLDMLRKIDPSENYDRSTWNRAKAREALSNHLGGKKLLLVLTDLDYPVIWNHIRRVLKKCAAGSAVVFSANDSSVADVCRPKKIMTYSPVDFYLKKADLVIPSRYRAEDHDRLQGLIKDILEKCLPDVECMNLFIHALHSYPDRPEKDLTSLRMKLDPEQSPTEKENTMIAFCYEALPKRYKNCLWYATVFSNSEANLRRASLVRRWVAQDLITQEDERSALEEAEHCFRVLVARKLLHPHDVGGAGRIKSCIVHQLVTDMISNESPTVEDLLLNNQVSLDSLKLLFSLRSGVQLHRYNNIMNSLRSLPTSSRRLLTVLDLEGRKGLKKHHIRNICRICNLKYLSLRNTDVAQLPKLIEQLRHLETLDIRGTRVQMLDVVLPMLRHLLAGFVDCPKEDNVRCKESFSTVCMPRHIANMEKLEILSRVKVTDSTKELIELGEKQKQLKKLGVVLSGKKANLKDLFTQIDKMHKSLRSLSIRMEQPGTWDKIHATLLRPPRYLESLNICGIQNTLPPRIKELHKLAKITLRDTFLREDSLNILGMLQCLRCLRLRHHSFAEGDLTFADGKFGSLMVLEIEDDILTRVHFASGTANKLKKMTWSFTHMESLFGIGNLLSLTKVKLNQGTCDVNGLQKLKDDITAHCNHVDFELNMVDNGQGSVENNAAL